MDSPSVRPMGLAQVLPALSKDGSVIPVEINLSPVEIEGHHFVWTAIRTLNDREPLFDRVREAVESALISLRGLIAICAGCYRIRDERG